MSHYGVNFPYIVPETWAVNSGYSALNLLEETTQDTGARTLQVL